MDRDSISNSDIGRPVVWNVTQEDSPEDSRGFQRSKKLSWSNGGPGPIVVNGHKVGHNKKIVFFKCLISLYEHISD